MQKAAKYVHNKRSRDFRPLIFWALVLVVSAIGLVILDYSHRSPIPPSISREASFTIMVPSKEVGGIDSKSVKYDASDKVISFKSNFNNSGLSIAEQAFPDQFVDVPQAYDKFLEQLPTVASFDTPNGQVNLAKPPNLHGSTLGVANYKGTFIFVSQTSGKLSEDQWKQFFKSFNAAK